MKATQLYQAGDLTAAVAAALEEVKQAPSDSGRRGFLCELLCFTGDLERADRQLDTLTNLAPEAAVGIALFRQLIRAEQARQQFYSIGAMPEFLGEPTPALKLYLEASIYVREQRPEEAAKLLAQAEEQRPKPKGICNGQPFEDFRDLDDLTAGFFEVLTSTGKYFWIPIERVETIEFRPPARPRDLLWQRAHLIVHNGPDGEVYLPTLYAGTSADADDKVRLGRYTDWRGGPGVPVRGAGQRTFLVGDEARSILELKEITIYQ